MLSTHRWVSSTDSCPPDCSTLREKEPADGCHCTGCEVDVKRLCSSSDIGLWGIPALWRSSCAPSQLAQAGCLTAQAATLAQGS